ncbi:MAG: PQQ-binding-like beta-propeller repeat protein, partial [Candidatus Limnocylindrales bacterium]
GSIESCGNMGFIGFLPDDTLVGITGVAGTSGGWIHRIDPATLTVKSSNQAHDGSPKSFAMNSDGTLVVTGASDGVVRVWEAATGKLLHQLSVDGQAQGVAFVGNDRVAVTPSGGGMLVFYIDTAKLLDVVRASIQRPFTPEECQRFGFVDDCPTLEELRASAP